MGTAGDQHMKLSGVQAGQSVCQTNTTYQNSLCSSIKPKSLEQKKRQKAGQRPTPLDGNGLALDKSSNALFPSSVLYSPDVFGFNVNTEGADTFKKLEPADNLAEESKLNSFYELLTPFEWSLSTAFSFETNHQEQ
uniref:Uncharacterized protein n=1 Tax=Ditylenchus dipsaci TaxID=166011 RepID=A0A915EC63_9BILA